MSSTVDFGWQKKELMNLNIDQQRLCNLENKQTKKKGKGTDSLRNVERHYSTKVEEWGYYGGNMRGTLMEIICKEIMSMAESIP